ncbi:hypothetical protein B0H11DRAFT_2031438 [Mycena galericulata]|nr:hypothetical protein B0H11DRAFT_2031438 [Mycena galericulata]
MDVQELVDFTIDFLYDSRADLKRCALVSRSWVFPAQFHLFSYCVLESERDCQNLYHVLATSSHIHSLIRHLAIAIFPWRTESSGAYEILAKMKSQFTHLQKISIYCRIPPHGVSVMQHLVSLPSVKHISTLRPQDANQLSLFCLREATLGTLEIGYRFLSGNATFSDALHPPIADPLPSQTARSTVECLDMWGRDDPAPMHSHQSLDMFLWVFDFSSLRRLIIHNCHGAERINDLLQHSDYISDLEIHGIIADPESFARQLNIGPSTLPHLARLTVHVLAPSTLATIPLLLSRLTPETRLQQLTLVVTRDCAPTTADLPSFLYTGLWMDVDAAAGTLASLFLTVKVSLTSSGVLENELGLVIFRECFPRLNGEARLYIQATQTRSSMH